MGKEAIQATNSISGTMRVPLAVVVSTGLAASGVAFSGPLATDSVTGAVLRVIVSFLWVNDLTCEGGWRSIGHEHVNDIRQIPVFIRVYDIDEVITHCLCGLDFSAGLEGIDGYPARI